MNLPHPQVARARRHAFLPSRQTQPAGTCPVSSAYFQIHIVKILASTCSFIQYTVLLKPPISKPCAIEIENVLNLI
jgi:hypothetical protein